MKRRLKHNCPLNIRLACRRFSVTQGGKKGTFPDDEYESSSSSDGSEWLDAHGGGGD